VNESPPRQRGVAARDYKHSGRGGGQSLFARYRDFISGLAIGLCVAAVVYVSDARQKASREEQQPQPRAAKPRTAQTEAEQPTAQYDFYDMLPKFEVVVPEKERDVRTDTPAAPVARPGVYVLQAGSYRNEADAERVRAQLAKQRIDANVQRVQVDADVWHRVRIGPLSDLARLNAMREALRRADIDTIVVRVGD
jgi:cell division protein FtsN